MIIARSSWSELSGGLGNEFRRSLGKRTREPQRKRIQFGLVTRKAVANLPMMVKPVTFPQATSTCVGRTVRGEREQRARKDMPRNLGGPFGWDLSQPALRMHKQGLARSEVGRVHSSKEAGNDRGAKGRDCRSVTNKTRRAA